VRRVSLHESTEENFLKMALLVHKNWAAPKKESSSLQRIDFFLIQASWWWSSFCTRLLPYLCRPCWRRRRRSGS
jgi:hypothetical protein